MEFSYSMFTKELLVLPKRGQPKLVREDQIDEALCKRDAKKAHSFLKEVKPNQED